MVTIVNNIQAIRIKKNMTQEYLARQCNITLRTMQRIESGHNTTIYNILKIKKALGINSLDTLFP